MTPFWLELALFGAKALTLVLLLLLALAGVLALLGAKKNQTGTGVRVKPLHQEQRAELARLQAEILPSREYKAWKKSTRREAKTRKQAALPRLFVLDFQGDLKASRVQALSQEINVLLLLAQPKDRVLLRLESAGGLVHAYGLAASQLSRIKAQGLELTTAVDKVAASGGYMMAAVGQRLVAAPFAVLGSIGVVAQLPNFHRWLKEHKIDFELLTAGKHKRTLTLFGDNQPEDREKFQSELEEAHRLFQDFLRQNRPSLDLGRVATGEHWYGTQALELGLVDEISTSDDLISQAAQEGEVFLLSAKPTPGRLKQWLDPLSGMLNLRSPIIP